MSAKNPNTSNVPNAKTPASKIPKSLRGALSAERLPRQSLASAGVVAAACLFGSDAAIAQNAPTSLPTMNVEAQRVRPKPAPVRRRVATPAPRPARPAAVVPSAAAQAPVQPAPGGTGPARAADANPYANAGAPYKVERSANSRITEPLVNTARSVTVVPKEVLEDKNATSVRELVRTTPGLTLGTGEGGNAFGDRVFIRGFDARNDMYINGVRESGVTTRETFMTEQVEIIKGPAGSISGRGTTGGAINIVTKQPSIMDFANFQTMVGTDQTRRFTFDINRNVTPDFSIRANALLQNAEVAGRDHLYDNRYGGSLAMQWRPTENFKTNLDYYFVRFESMPDWGVPFDPRTRRPFTESGLNRENFYGVPSRDFQRNQQHMLTHSLEWKLSPYVTLTSKSRFSDTITDYVATKPGTPNLSNPDPSLWTVSVSPASRYQVNRSIANQTEATTKFETGAFKHTLVTGVEIQRERISQQGYSGLAVECNPTCGPAGNNVTTNLWNPYANIVAFGGVPTRSGTPTRTTVDTLAAYALDTINWNDRVFLNFGGRVDKYDITRAPFTGASYGRDDVLFNWNVGLTYKVLPNASVYAAYATSSNPVGSELDAGGDDYGGITVGNAVFRPERNTSLEVGTKWEFFDKRLLLTGAFFRTTKENARETVGGVLSDTAAYEIHGFDFGATGNITDDWSVFAGMTLMRSEVTDSAVANNLGRPLANIAHTSFNVLTKYKVTNQLTVGAQATYRGPILGGTIAANYFAPGTINVGGSTVPTPVGYNELPGKWRFDLMSEYQFNKTFSAKLQVQNIFNTTIYDAFYRSGSPYVYIAPGRAAYLTVSAKY